MIIFSPSKTMDISGLVDKKTKITFDYESNFLRNLLLSLSVPELARLFKISEQKANSVWEYLRLSGVKPAINLYTGVSYSEITHDNLDYLHNHVFIISALYGIIPADCEIAPYRLDFLTKLPETNLYQFWQDKITNYIHQQNPEFIVNLASNEFSKLFSKEFKTITYNLELDQKVSSTVIKKIRGQLLDLAIAREITTIEGFDNLSSNLIKITKLDKTSKKIMIYLK